MYSSGTLTQDGPGGKAVGGEKRGVHGAGRPGGKKKQLLLQSVEVRAGKSPFIKAEILEGVIVSKVVHLPYACSSLGATVAFS